MRRILAIFSLVGFLAVFTGCKHCTTGVCDCDFDTNRFCNKYQLTTESPCCQSTGEPTPAKVIEKLPEAHGK